MKWRRAVVAAVLLAVPMLAWAQTVTQDGQRTDPGRRVAGQGMAVGGIDAETLFVIPRFDASKNLKTAEQTPIFDQHGISQSIISGVTLAAAAADSSSPIATHKYRIVGLLIKAVPSTGTGGINRLAFQIRAHLNGQADSSSTFAWYPQATTNMGAAATAALDTTFMVGHQITPASTTPGSGEFTVIVNRNRNAPGDGAAAVPFSYPSGIYLPLSTFFGTDFWSPWTSVRVRNLVGPSCKVTVHLVGTPL